MSPPATLSRAVLAAGALPLFFLSFLMSANANVLPQLFFQRGYPGQKAGLLALALLLATVAAVLGTGSARLVRLHRHGLAAGLLAAVAVPAALLSVRTAAPFMLLLALAQFANNFLLNQLDHAAVARAGALSGFNDTASNGARLGGMLLAPLFFTATAADTGLQRLAVALLGAAALAGGLGLLRLPCGAAGPAVGTPAAGAPPDGRDRLLFGHALAVYAGLYLLAANLIFLLQDLLQRPGAQRQGGVLITLVFGAAIAANAATGPLRQRLGRDANGTPSRCLLALPALALAVAAGALLAGLRPDDGVCAAGAVALGASYGVFLRELRGHASAAARAGRPALLGWFNNVANLSALLAFGLMLALSRALPASGFHAGVLGAIVALQLGGMGLLWQARARRAPAEAQPAVAGFVTSSDCPIDGTPCASNTNTR